MWVDAKYTYKEKSFLKIALMGPPFPKFRSKIYRWADLMGHESALLDPELCDEIIVLFFSFFFTSVTFSSCFSSCFSSFSSFFLIFLISDNRIL